MNVMKEIEKRILILDGAMGTELIKEGIEIEPPERLNMENPEIIEKIHRAYIDAGADIIETNTFGANRIKLKNYGIEDRVFEINKRAVELAKKAAMDKEVFIAGSIGPTGKLISPLGEAEEVEIYYAYYEQAKALIEGGVDLIIIETQIDLLEAKLAAIASKDAGKAPIALSISFPMEGLTVTGSSPEEAAITVDALPVDIVGVNCGGHPKEFISFIKEYREFTDKPIIVYPNAGIPVKKDGKVFYPLKPNEYIKYIEKFYELGVNILGGCCGTTPKHISTIVRKFKHKKPLKQNEIDVMFTASSRNRSFIVKENSRFLIIGENINPFGKKKFLKELKERRFDTIRKLSREQEKEGASALDINLGKTGEKDSKFYKNAIKEIQTVSKLPLFIDNSNPESIKEAFFVYGGKPVLNSINGTKKAIEELFPLAKRFGASIVLLLISEDGIPEKSKDKIKLVEELIRKAFDYGFRRRDIIIDPVVLTVSTGGSSAIETLKTIEILSKMGFSTTIGLSNVSFGLPKRELLNRVFLSMAIERGLRTAILNPLNKDIKETINAADVLKGRTGAMDVFIKKARNFEVETTVKENNENLKENLTDDEKLFRAIVEGEEKIAYELTKRIIEKGKHPLEILSTVLSPALNYVGELYEKKIYFLPQLIRSAQAMEWASKIIESSLTVDKKDDFNKKVKIVLATVKGDLHDIGKNIVSLVLRNYGYDVIDLGKNVDSEKIVKTAIKEHAEVIGLSALMTTTMENMRDVVELRNKIAKDVKVIIGGAAVSPSFAREIGADAYGKDPLDAVKKLKKLIEK